MTPNSEPRTPSHVPSGVALFWWVRLRTGRAAARELWHAPLKLSVIVAVWSVLLVGLYVIAYRGIRFIDDTAGLGPFMLSRLWYLFLFVIFVLLMVSQFTSVYSTVIRAPETRWWMTLPVSARTLARAKWLESSLYSAWAVVMLVFPMLAAYVVVLQKPWGIVVAAAAALLVPLIGIATALATLLFLGGLRWFGWIAIRRELVPFAFLTACGVLFWLLGERRGSAQEDAWFLALQGLLPRMKLATASWLPSRWVAAGLDAMMTSRRTEVFLYTALLWTTALLCWRALDHVAARMLLPLLRRHAHMPELSVGEAAAAGGPPATFPLSWWMHRPLAAAMMKDALLVIRDPMQWSQAVVFFGLLGVYFANIHRLAYMSVEPGWRIGVACLNLACTLLVFGSLTVRFLFPQMSLEGRSLWLLRVAPFGMRRLMLAKLWLYGIVGVAIVEGLLLVSMHRLGVPLSLRWWMAGVGVCAAMTLVGLAVGLGAWWIDPTAQDAARLISSSAGALVLVLMLGYVGCVIAALAVAWKSWHDGGMPSVVLASLGLVVVSALAGLVPVWRGYATLERLET